MFLGCDPSGKTRVIELPPRAEPTARRLEDAGEDSEPRRLIDVDSMRQARGPL